MDRVVTLAETMRAVIKSYATEDYTGDGEPSKFYFVENEQEQVFAVIGPYESAIKQAHLILMAHILNDQIIIDQDNTSVSPVMR